MDLTILVIDDDKVDRTQLRRLLNDISLSINVLEAASGDEGKLLIAEKQPDCVFLDYRLPDIDGIGLLEELYDADQDLTPVPVVMLTGQGGESLVAEAFQLGALDYLDKNGLSVDVVRLAMTKAREVHELKKNRIQIQDELFQAQKMEAIGQLTGGLAHDFNNLLTIILGNLELLERCTSSDRKVSRRVKSALGAAEKGAELTKRLLAFSRKQSLEPEVINPNDLVVGMHELLSRTLGDSIELASYPSEDLWSTRADPTQLEGAILNLAINARDAMPRGGRLTIETKNVTLDEDYVVGKAGVRPGEHAMIAVSDNGTGIKKELLESIFQPFFSTKEVGEGSGLGLSMVQGFIKQTGGHVKVYSEEGVGSTFKLYLPRKKMAADKPDEQTAQSDVMTGTETILVVEDDSEVREITMTLLEDLGYQVVESHDAADAIDKLHGPQAIDLLFSDIVMPGEMNGFDLANYAKENFPGLKILHTSGFAAGALLDSDYTTDSPILGKPYRKSELATKVRQVLEEPSHAR